MYSSWAIFRYFRKSSIMVRLLSTNSCVWEVTTQLQLSLLKLTTACFFLNFYFFIIHMCIQCLGHHCLLLQWRSQPQYAWLGQRCQAGHWCQAGHRCQAGVPRAHPPITVILCQAGRRLTLEALDWLRRSFCSKILEYFFRSFLIC
jgi:hypothetical protein